MQSLHFTDQHADLLYGAFSTLLYLMSLRGLYYRPLYWFPKNYFMGRLLIYTRLSAHSTPKPAGFFIGLALLVVANGLFKPNVSSIVGTLYRTDDPRRDGGFTLFYMGINVGSLIPPIFIGTVVHYYGWHAGFLFATLGMVIGMITFLIGRKRLGNRDLPTQSPLNSFSVKIKFNTVLCLGIIASVALIKLCFDFPASTNTIVVIGTFFNLPCLSLFPSQRETCTHNEIK